MAHSTPTQAELNFSPTCEIPLRNGLVVIVDAEDYEWLSQWKWKAKKGYSTIYAVRRSEGHLIFMHRAILGVTDPRILVDHKNRNGLDNRRDNIRVASRAQNMHNRISSSNNTSGYKGVHWDKRKEKWIAAIGIDGRRKHLGNFDSSEDAARAYDQAARELHGNFALLNFPDDPPIAILPSDWNDKGRLLSVNTSGFRGVYWSKVANKWHAQIEGGGKRMSLGYYRDIEEAARAYDAAAKQFHGEAARLNFPDGATP